MTEEIPNARHRLADYLSEYAHSVVEEWMRIVEIDADVEEPGSSALQARATWMGDNTFMLGQHSHDAELGQYRLTVRVEALPDLSPIGPENDPAQRYENAIEPVEPAPEWIETVWLHVRAGDRVRIGAQEAVVTTTSAGDWHAHVESKRMESGRWWDNVTPWEHKEVRVRLQHLGEQVLPWPPNTPIDVLMDRERQAIHLLQTIGAGTEK